MVFSEPGIVDGTFANYYRQKKPVLYSGKREATPAIHQ